MRNLLTAAAVLLALATVPAKADNLHPLFLGKWCSMTETSFYFAPDDEACENSREQLTISRTRLAGLEWECKVFSITTPPSVRRETAAPRCL
jgi:hypothetical protein